MTVANINVEQTVIRNLLTNDYFLRKVLPFIRPEYFEGVYKPLFKQLCVYVAHYNKLPTLEAYKLQIDEANFSEQQYNEAVDILPDLYQKIPDTDNDWLIETAEKWCQDRAVFNAIMESISIIDNKHDSLTKTAIPDILTKALGVSFDTNIGHDYVESWEARYEFYHSDEARIAFDVEVLNRITKGGLPNKTLNVILAGTGVGKSLAMCHMAAANLTAGYDVLYITMEMSEEKIAERIDANLMDVPIDQIDNLPKNMFLEKLSRIKTTTTGKLIIKEYPTGAANASHFRALINELKLKKNFRPQIIYIDYLNICSSSRMKAMGGSINSYTYIKAIAEELRGLAVEFVLPIVTATQTTRGGYASSDPGLDDTSESFGLPATADLMIALVSTEELEAQGQIMGKQLKNRYNDVSRFKRFIIGIDRSKMRLFDVIDEEQTLMDDTPVFDKSETQGRFNDFKME
jgi:replicative DNA helicase